MLSVLIMAMHCTACRYDSDCGQMGRCDTNGRCVQTHIECQRNLDCLGRGLYFECTNLLCQPSKHKICRGDDECKNNLLHKKCINDRCSSE